MTMVLFPELGMHTKVGRTIVTQPEYMSAPELEELTGTPESTWRYWPMIGTGPASFKLGRRRVWKRSTVLAWLESQEKASARPTIRIRRGRLKKLRAEPRTTREGPYQQHQRTRHHQRGTS
jgi:prophage regulatory protein